MRKSSSLAQTELAGEFAIRITLSIPYADLAARPFRLLSLSLRHGENRDSVAWFSDDTASMPRRRQDRW